MKKNIKFILLLILIMFCGAAVGIMGSSFNLGKIIYDFFLNLQKIVDRNIFLIYMGFVLVVDLAIFVFYVLGKKKVLKDLKKDDGVIDEKYLSIAMGLTSIGMVVPIILLFNYVKAYSIEEFEPYRSLMVMVLFFANVFYLSFMQSVMVKFLKSYNPEKYDNVLDMKFTKKFMATMDERELFQAYKASFKAYRYMMGTIFVLIAIFAIVSVDAGGSPLPMYALGLVFLVGSITYLVEAIKN